MVGRGVEQFHARYSTLAEGVLDDSEIQTILELSDLAMHLQPPPPPPPAG